MPKPNHSNNPEHSNSEPSWLDAAREYFPAIAVGTLTTAAGVGVARAAESWLGRKAAENASRESSRAAGAIARKIKLW